MQIAIAEDEFIVAEQLKHFVEWAGHKVNIVEHNKNSFIHALIGQQIDLALLDIRMEEKNTGFEIARYLKDRKVPFIFISAHSDLNTLEEATKLNPVGYITKPFNKVQIRATLATLSGQIEDAVIELKSGREIHKIKRKDILYVKADNVYCEVYTREARIIVRSTLRALEEQLLDDYIKRCHRSFLVNTRYIQVKATHSVTVGDKEIPWNAKYPL